MGCASVLTDALVQGGIKNPSKIAPNRGRGFVIVLGEMSHEANLAPVAKIVNAALTPHREQVAPGVSVEVYAKLDEKSAEAAKAALAKIRGADAAHSVIDLRRGAIGVRLTGEGKLSVKGIIAALADAGIAARVRTGETSDEPAGS